MTTVDSAAAVSSALSQSTSSSSAAQSSLADYDDFLTLLTTQLRNQDPLNPQDSTEFVEQIATFTNVEQQIAANGKLDQLIALQTGGQLVDLAQWVGREVSAEGVTVDYQGGEISVDVPSSGGADTSELVIRDHNGSEIARLSAPTAGGTVVWDGTETDGGKAAYGLYQVEFAFTTTGANGADVETVTPRSTGVVIEARLNDAGETELVLEGGIVVVRPDDVTSVREPTSAAEVAETTEDEEDQTVVEAVVEDVTEAAEDVTDDVTEAVTEAAEDVTEAVETAAEEVS